MSQNQLQQAAKLDQGDVTRIITGEKGKNLSAEKFLAMARALDVNPHWLWDNSGPKRLSSGPPKTNRDRAADVARVAKISEAAITAGLAHFDGFDDAPFLDIFDEIRQADRREGLRSALEVQGRQNQRKRFKAAKRGRTTKTKSPSSVRAPKRTGST